MGYISFGGKLGEDITRSEVVEDEEMEGSLLEPTPTTPLLLETRNGIVELVEEILGLYPQAVEHVSEKGQHIMHVSIRYRQKDIFRLVKKIMRIPMARLVRKIDNDGNTLLHHVADMTDFRGGTQPNPALQLQDELEWFEVILVSTLSLFS